MAYVITEACIGTKDASCVEACPVDCIHSTDADEQYYIDPDACIDCALCQPECPIGAIVASEDEDPEWAAINAELAPAFRENPAVAERPRNDPPRRPGNVIVNP